MCGTKNDGMKNEPINKKNELHNKCKKNYMDFLVG
jgi:hypothetical protein